jgi:hypothetical protein
MQGRGIQLWRFNRQIPATQQLWVVRTAAVRHPCRMAVDEGLRRRLDSA